MLTYAKNVGRYGYFRFEWTSLTDWLWVHSLRVPRSNWQYLHFLRKSRKNRYFLHEMLNIGSI